MTILVKCLSKNQRVYAFSLLEILIVLVIIGIILTIPRWPLISSNLLNRVNNKMQISQSKEDNAIFFQSGMSAKRIMIVNLEPLCPSKSINIFLGGWLKPSTLECDGKKISIGALGALRIEPK